MVRCRRQIQDKGTFVADYGADFGGRALPQSKLDGDAATGKGPDQFKGYEVLKPIPMIEGDAIPWFGQPGGGKQYELPMGITKLIEGGYIREIAAPNLHGGDGTTNKTGDGGDGTDGNNTSKVDPTKTDGGDGTDGGGMKGKDVYPVAPEGQKISDLDGTQVNTLVVDTVSSSSILPDGSSLSHGQDGKLNLTISNGEGNPPIAATVTINPNFDPSGSAAHGGDQGAANNKITIDAEGNIHVEIGLSGNHNQADVDKMVAHEFTEVADILQKVEAHKRDNPDATPESINDLIKAQQEASVFKENGSTDPNDMTAHDKAVVRELEASLADLHEAIVNGGELPSSQVLRLLDSMGIELSSDPRLTLLKETLGLDVSPEVDAWLAAHIGAVRGDLDFSTMGISDVLTHIKSRDMSVERKKGIGGCHDKSEFAGISQLDISANPTYLPPAGKTPGVDCPEVFVLARTPHASVPGVEIVDYKIPALARDLKTDGNLKNPAGPKTLYDPAIWTDSKLTTALQEALEYNARKNGGVIQTKFQGTTKEGYRIEGYFRNGKVETFYFI